MTTSVQTTYCDPSHGLARVPIGIGTASAGEQGPCRCSPLSALAQIGTAGRTSTGTGTGAAPDRRPA